MATLAAIKVFPHVYDNRLWCKYHPAPTPTQPKDENPHYRAWVSEITLDRLLSNPDEVETGQIYLFHSAPAEICDTILTAARGRLGRLAGDHDWVTDPLEVRTTIGNLKGVPYALDSNHLGAGPAMTTQFWEMHRDNIGFAIGTSACGGVATGLGLPPDCHYLPACSFNFPPPSGAAPLVQACALFRAAMVATSAIPLVFKVTDVPQNPIVYDWRTAYWDRDRSKPVVDQPVWPGGAPDNPYCYSATDGGLFDSQPFDVAHQRLAGVRGANPQAGGEACRAIILIDPLAQDREPIPSNPDKTQIFDVISKLVLAPILQDRLDAIDLAQIKDETIFSRFMIAPSRENPNNGAISWSPSKSLLSAPMDAFLGYAAEVPYREHDFLLGRRNAQQFLRKTFVLPTTNPLVSGGTGWLSSDEFTDSGVTYRALVPLRGRAADRQPVPDWNWQALRPEKLTRYQDLVRARADAIFHNLKTTTSRVAGSLAGLLASIST